MLDKETFFLHENWYQRTRKKMLEDFSEKKTTIIRF